MKSTDIGFNASGRPEPLADDHVDAVVNAVDAIDRARLNRPAMVSSARRSLRAAAGGASVHRDGDGTVKDLGPDLLRVATAIRSLGEEFRAKAAAQVGQPVLLSRRFGVLQDVRVIADGGEAELRLRATAVVRAGKKRWRSGE